MDCAHIHIGEQQHEHDGLDRREDQQVWDALDLDEVALRNDQTIRGRLGQDAHACFAFRSRRPALPSVSDGSAASSAAWPVNDKNTSSRVGRRIATSLTTTPALSSWRNASMSTADPPCTATDAAF